MPLIEDDQSKARERDNRINPSEDIGVFTIASAKLSNKV